MPDKGSPTSLTSEHKLYVLKMPHHEHSYTTGIIALYGALLRGGSSFSVHLKRLLTVTVFAPGVFS